MAAATVTAVIHNKACHNQSHKAIVANPAQNRVHLIKSVCKAFAFKFKIAVQIHTNKNNKADKAETAVGVSQNRRCVKACFYRLHKLCKEGVAVKIKYTAYVIKSRGNILTAEEYLAECRK